MKVLQSFLKPRYFLPCSASQSNDTAPHSILPFISMVLLRIHRVQGKKLLRVVGLLDWCHPVGLGGAPLDLVQCDCSPANSPVDTNQARPVLTRYSQFRIFFECRSVFIYIAVHVVCGKVNIIRGLYIFKAFSRIWPFFSKFQAFPWSG